LITRHMPAFLPSAEAAPSPLDLFATIDVDQSGSIDRDEFSVALKERLKLSQKQIDGLFTELDRNNDGSISLLEFVKVLKAQPEIFERASLLPNIPAFRRGQAEEKASLLSPIDYFEAVDTDGSGSLSLGELQAALKLSHFSDAGIRAIFDECKQDKAGDITLLEWMRVVQERAELLPSRLERPPAFLSAESPIDLFTAIDQDGSGAISREEFGAALSARFMSAACAPAAGYRAVVTRAVGAQ